MSFLEEWASFHYLYRYLVSASFSVPLALPTTIRVFVCSLPFSGNCFFTFYCSLQFQLFFHFSLLTFKLVVNIVLLGASCHMITQHRQALDDKVNKTLGGQSASLPASRHNSVTDLTILDEEEKLMELKEKIIEHSASPSKQAKAAVASSINSGARSTPHSPSSSPRNSLEDITEQVAIAQNTLDSLVILSDSTVSLVSMNDGQNLKLPNVPSAQKENAKSKQKVNSPRRKLFSLGSFPSLKRRVSLQELPNNVNLDNFTDTGNKQVVQDSTSVPAASAKAKIS